MLIKIEEAQMPEEWLVWMDAWCVRFRSYAEAEALEGRLNAPLPFAHQHE
jgi:hypothetical protein